MRILSSIFAAIAGVFRRKPADPDPSASATIELTSDDIEVID